LTFYSEIPILYGEHILFFTNNVSFIHLWLLIHTNTVSFLGSMSLGLYERC